MQLTTNFNSIKQLSDKPKYAFVKQALTFLSGLMEPSRFEHMYLSFNGGKDATVVLFLTLTALQFSKVKGSKLKCIYFAEQHPFEEVDQFIANIIKTFNIEWHELPSKNYQKQLNHFVSQKTAKYIVMGSRRNDPYCEHLQQLSFSDMHKGFPDFIRVNPVIDWSYEQIWAFLKDFSIPYCKLYDEGYTYLGDKKNTQKNPALLDSHTSTYRPAHHATEQTEKHSRSAQKENNA